MSTKSISWSLSQLRGRVIYILQEALNRICLDIGMKKVYLRDNEIVIEGEYSSIIDEGKYKIVLKNEDLSLISCEILSE